MIVGDRCYLTSLLYDYSQTVKIMPFSTKILLAWCLFTLMTLSPLGQFPGHSVVAQDGAVVVEAGSVEDKKVENHQLDETAATEDLVEDQDLANILDGGVPQGVADLVAMEKRVREVVKRIMPSIVAVQVDEAQGSGVIISREGFILTAGHVIGESGKRAGVIFSDNKRSRGETLGADHNMDSGLLKISREGPWPYVEMGTSTGLKRGQWVLAVGHPGGYMRDRPPVVRLGRILSLTDDAIRTDCPLIGGDSGGPLFDLNGNVIGINSRIGGELSNNLHVPINTYGVTWDRLAKGEVFGQVQQPSLPTSREPYIGIKPASDGEDAQVGEVVPGRAAEEAGIKTGDIIVEFDGKSIDSFETLAKAVRARSPGDVIGVVVRRGQKSITLPLTIGARR